MLSSSIAAIIGFDRTKYVQIGVKLLILLRLSFFCSFFDQGVARKMTRAADHNLLSCNFSNLRRNPTTPPKTSSENNSKTLSIALQSILILKTINHTSAQLNALTGLYNA